MREGDEEGFVIQVLVRQYEYTNAPAGVSEGDAGKISKSGGEESMLSSTLRAVPCLRRLRPGRWACRRTKTFRVRSITYEIISRRAGTHGERSGGSGVAERRLKASEVNEPVSSVGRRRLPCDQRSLRAFSRLLIGLPSKAEQDCVFERRPAGAWSYRKICTARTPGCIPSVPC